MALTNAYRDSVAAYTIGGGTFFNAANAFIGVGDSATAFAFTQTDLQAATNKIRKGMDSGNPTSTANTMTFRSTFSTTEANWAWAEWGVFNAASGGTMMNRKVEALGTKSSVQAWQLTVTITLAVA